MAKLNKIHDSDLVATGSFDAKKKEAYRQAKSLLSDTELLETDPHMILIGKLNDRVSDLVDESNTNDDKTGITPTQADAIVTNSGKAGMVLGTTKTTALAGNTITISPAQAAAIVLNTAKIGITTEQARQRTTNSAKAAITFAKINKITDFTIGIGEKGHLVIEVSGIAKGQDRPSVFTYLIAPEG